ncbi:Gfo/Idh/MocA family oxidoreductase [Crenobacter sp. SG2303]|uniref:Gfo/Idh/MocA family oxidoreductase n=1 Tax=Crenobacter oryzisoli TaxID=3056844 RepID=A0ABT7XQ11_9NEIS|nr:Gfo/Idh/MocA family oxidoreductase [Crenobacter sp. SG2303]MDN0075830.1 Gfo/Idh/MocA family oxidoreductase [Crenobacter sp. SG2303]
MAILNVALIGCGKIGYSFINSGSGVGVYTHAEAYARADGLQLVAVVDPDIQRAHECAKRYGVDASRVYGSTEDFFRNETVDIISIASPDATHVSLVRQALAMKSVKGIFLEKPLALTLEDAQGVLAEVRRSNIPVLVNYSRRYCSEHRKLASLIRSGTLGEVQTVNGFYTKGLMHNGTHWLDLFDWFFGEIKMAVGWESASIDFQGDPTLNVHLRSRAVSAMLHGCDARYFSVFEMDVVTDKGRVQIVDGGGKIVVSRVFPSAIYHGYTELKLVEEWSHENMKDLLLRAVEDLRDSILESRQPVSNAENAFRALRAANTAMREVVSW